MTIEAGKLRHRVRIEKYDYLRDSSGEVIQNPNTGEVSQEWVLVDEVWASIEPLSAREFIQSAAIQSEISSRITIRYRDGMDASMRLIHVRIGRPDTIYDPHAFLTDRESGLEYMTIPCSVGVGEGQ